MLLSEASFVSLLLTTSPSFAQDITFTNTLTTCRDGTCTAKQGPTPDLQHDITHTNTRTICDKPTCTKHAPLVITESVGTCTTSCSQLHYTAGTTTFTLACCQTSTCPPKKVQISTITTTEYAEGSAPPPNTVYETTTAPATTATSTIFENCSGASFNSITDTEFVTTTEYETGPAPEEVTITATECGLDCAAPPTTVTATEYESGPAPEEVFITTTECGLNCFTTVTETGSAPAGETVTECGPECAPPVTTVFETQCGSDCAPPATTVTETEFEAGPPPATVISTEFVTESALPPTTVTQTEFEAGPPPATVISTEFVTESALPLTTVTQTEFEAGPPPATVISTEFVTESALPPTTVTQTEFEAGPPPATVVSTEFVTESALPPTTVTTTQFESGPAPEEITIISTQCGPECAVTLPPVTVVSTETTVQFSDGIAPPASTIIQTVTPLASTESVTATVFQDCSGSAPPASTVVTTVLEISTLSGSVETVTETIAPGTVIQATTETIVQTVTLPGEAVTQPASTETVFEHDTEVETVTVVTAPGVSILTETQVITEVPIASTIIETSTVTPPAITETVSNTVTAAGEVVTATETFTQACTLPPTPPPEEPEEYVPVPYEPRPYGYQVPLPPPPPTGPPAYEPAQPLPPAYPDVGEAECIVPTGPRILAIVDQDDWFNTIPGGQIPNTNRDVILVPTGTLSFATSLLFTPDGQAQIRNRAGVLLSANMNLGEPVSSIYFDQIPTDYPPQLVPVTFCLNRATNRYSVAARENGATILQLCPTNRGGGETERSIVIGIRRDPGCEAIELADQNPNTVVPYPPPAPPAPGPGPVDDDDDECFVPNFPVAFIVAGRPTTQFILLNPGGDVATQPGDIRLTTDTNQGGPAPLFDFRANGEAYIGFGSTQLTLNTETVNVVNPMRLDNAANGLEGRATLRFCANRATRLYTVTSAADPTFNTILLCGGTGSTRLGGLIQITRSTQVLSPQCEVIQFQNRDDL